MPSYIHSGRHVCDCLLEERTANQHKPAQDFGLPPSNIGGYVHIFRRMFQVYKGKSDNAFVLIIYPGTRFHTSTDKAYVPQSYLGTGTSRKIDISAHVSIA